MPAEATPRAQKWVFLAIVLKCGCNYCTSFVSDVWNATSVHSAEVLLICSWLTELHWCYLPGSLPSWACIWRPGIQIPQHRQGSGCSVSWSSKLMRLFFFHDDTIKVEWIGKSIRFLLWLLSNSITAVPLGPKAITVSKEVLKKDLWIRAVVCEGKMQTLGVPERGVILWKIKRAGEMYSWHWVFRVLRPVAQLERSSCDRNSW